VSLGKGKREPRPSTLKKKEKTVGGGGVLRSFRTRLIEGGRGSPLGKFLSAGGSFFVVVFYNGRGFYSLGRNASQ